MPLACSSRLISAHTSGSKPPNRELSGPFLQPDTQRKNAQKVIDSSDFLLFHPVTQERSGEGRGVSTTGTLGPKKQALWTEKRGKHGIQRAGLNTYVCGNHPTSPRAVSPRSCRSCRPLTLFSSLAPSLSSLSVTAVAVLCYRKRCGPRSAATSSTLLTHTLVLPSGLR